MKNAVCVVAVISVLGGATASAQQAQQGLVDLSIQDLLNIEVTSVSRKPQEVGRTAAAVYVITRDDIRRSGATTLPDVLRMAPGFSVAELNANTWSVTARGFGGVHANKLLVLIDGRSVYTPLNGGVYWEMQLLPLDAIEQIEIIRGPGGSLWGSNAINGIINIITKTADRTVGGHVATHVGRYEPGNVDFGYGGKMGATGHYVTRARYSQRRAPGLTQGLANGDDVGAFYGRTRLDWGAGTDRFSFQADAERGDGNQVQSTLTLSPPFRIATRQPTSFAGASTMLSWKRTNSSRVDTSLQTYYSGFSRSELNEQAHAFDVDVRQHRAVGDRHDIVVGAEYRFTEGTVGSSPTVTITPAHTDGHLGTAFVQDEIALSDHVRVTGGVKVERNQNTGFEIQPSARVLWSFSPRQSIWSSVSRAVRTPNRYERGRHVIASTSAGPAGLPLAVTLDGSTDTVSESLIESEVGYRVQRRGYSFDLAGFAGEYMNLASLDRGIQEIGQEMGTQVLRVPFTSGNSAHADTRGVELAGTWKPARWWEVAAHYSFTKVRFLSSADGSVDKEPVSGPVPTQQVHVRTFMDLPRNIEAGVLFYRASAMPGINIEPFKRLDLQAAWSPSTSVRLSGGVRSLLHGATTEYADDAALAMMAPVRPNPYFEIRWGF